MERLTAQRLTRSALRLINAARLVKIPEDIRQMVADELGKDPAKATNLELEDAAAQVAYNLRNDAAYQARYGASGREIKRLSKLAVSLRSRMTRVRDKYYLSLDSGDKVKIKTKEGKVILVTFVGDYGTRTGMAEVIYPDGSRKTASRDDFIE